MIVRTLLLLAGEEKGEPPSLLNFSKNIFRSINNSRFTEGKIISLEMPGRV